MSLAINTERPENIQALIDKWLEQEQNGVRFPVDFDTAWYIAGYSRKDSAKRKLSKMIEGIDFQLFTEVRKRHQGGTTPVEVFQLSISGFVKFLILSGSQESRNLILSIFSAIAQINFGKFDNQADSTGFVYLVKQSINGFYKIGKSKNPYRRLQFLQTGSPLQLEIIERIFSFDCHRLESLLHEYYEAYWVRGEWFELPDECVKEFLSVATKLDGQEESKFLLKTNSTGVSHE